MASYSLVCGYWVVTNNGVFVDKFFSQAYADRLTRKLNNA